MADTFYEAFNALDNELAHINSLLEGAWQITEHTDDESAVIDLLYLAQQKAEQGRELLKTMNREHRKATGQYRAEAES